MRSKGLVSCFIIILLASGAAGARDLGPCTEESAQEKPGAWRGTVENGVDVAGSSIAKPEQPDVIKRMAVFAEVLHQALGEQKGYDAKWYRSTGERSTRMAPRATA